MRRKMLGGRVHSAGRDIPVPDISSAIPYKEEFLRHLEEILQSPAFKGSRRSQDFLRYVVVRALNDEGERLKERILGAEVFNRSVDYDTGTDAIVRVTAIDVRKRLLQFYSEHGAGEFNIHIASGSYIPTFRHTSSADVAIVKEAPIGEIGRAHV